MDLARLSDIALPDQHGEVHRLGDLWRRPARSCSCSCGTSGASTAASTPCSCATDTTSMQAEGIRARRDRHRRHGVRGAFVRDEAIPYLVLVDDDAEAATRRFGQRRRGIACLHPSHAGRLSIEAWKRGAPHPQGGQARRSSSARRS